MRKRSPLERWSQVRYDRGVKRFVCGLVCLWACNGTDPVVSTHAIAPTGAVIATVGGEPITAEAVAAVSKRQSLSAEEALGEIVSDVLFARAARAAGLDRSAEVRARRDGLLARQLLVALERDASNMGLPTETELSTFREQFWYEVHRPEAFRTVHVVAQLDEKSDASARQQAQELIALIHRHVSEGIGARASLPPMPARKPWDPPPGDDGLVEIFRTLTQEVLGDKQVRFEELSPVTADGRVISRAGGSFDPAFAQAASRLSKRGEVSPVVESPFGYHVLVLLERIAPLEMSPESEVAHFSPEIYRERARRLKGELLAKLRAQVEVVPNADGELGLISIQ